MHCTLLCKTWSKMAAVTKLGLFLIVLISGIHGEENLYDIMEKGAVYTFHPLKEANFCVIYRSIGEENLVLWNTSDSSPENPTLPEDFKKRLGVSNKKIISSYEIHNLTHSDSGLYREECWTGGNVTHQRSTRITVCSTIEEERTLRFSFGVTMDIPCQRERVGDNRTVQWFKLEDSHWTRMFMDDNRSLNPPMKHLEGRVQLVENSSSLRISQTNSGDVLEYKCLVMERQQCVSSNNISLFMQEDYIFHSVGEEAVLPCFDTDLYGPPLYWIRGNNGKKFLVPPSQNHSEGFGNLTDREQQYRYSDDPVVNGNFSLVFSSLTLNHSGMYNCANDQYVQLYLLLVCPDSAPITQFFSDGEEVTLNCNHSDSESFIWFRRIEQEEAVMFDAFISVYVEDNPQFYDTLRVRLNVSNGTMVLSDLSVEDSGEYWCVVEVSGVCKSTAKIILFYKHPFGIDSTFYTVWSSLMSCGLLGMVCAVVTVIMKTRRRDQASVM